MRVTPTLIKSTQWLYRTRISKCNNYADKEYNTSNVNVLPTHFLNAALFQHVVLNVAK